MIKANKPLTEEMKAFLEGKYDVAPEEYEYELHTGFSKPYWLDRECYATKPVIKPQRHPRKSPALKKSIRSKKATLLL